MLLRQIGAFSRTYRHINRYRQILTIFFKYGFGDLIERLNISQYLEFGRRLIFRSHRVRAEKLTRAERLRLACADLGPTFIKLAQILSTRPDLIPLEFAQELAKLQDQAPPFPFAQVKEIIEEEFKTPLENKFASFDPTPLAAASIGQVHRARLLGGEEVVVKVQRPGIRQLIEVDLEILFHLAVLMERHIEELARQKPTRIVEEFARVLEKEIDYEIEASNLERFAQQFLDHPYLYVPRLYRAVCSSKVLTMEYISGIKASEIHLLDQEGFDRKEIASRGADLILEQIFRHGFFHADPHPGNIFVLPGNRICYLDFGMMGSVDRQAREDFADLIYAYVRRDERKIVSALLKIIEWEEEPDRRALEKDIADFIAKYFGRPLKELRVAIILKDLLDLINRHHLRLPPDIYLMGKALATAEGVGLALDPDMDMANKAAPFIKQLKIQRFSPQRIWKEFLGTGEDLLQLLKEIPGDLQDMLRQIKQGKYKIGLELRGLNQLSSQIDRASNRLAFSILISALIISSSLIISTNIGPFLLGFPVLGILGFGIAGIFAIWLLISILRSGRF
ncbi:MAG: ABC1 kinase family protein [Thermodesulfobacteriota bacterium]